MGTSSRARTWLAGLAVVAAAVLPYLPTLGAGFVFDDHVLVERSTALAGPLLDLWAGRGVHDYWPLTWTSLWLDQRLFGLDPAAYHSVNVVLHALTALLSWRVLVSLRVPGALLGAILFAVHPVAVESVAWISERKNVLSGVLFFASTLAWLRFDRQGGRRHLAASLGLFLLALLAKTSVVMLPVVILLLVLHQRGRIVWKDVLVTLPYFALSLVLGLVTVWYQWTRAVGEQTGAPRGIAERLAASAWAYLHYLRTALVPVRLGVVYPEWPVAPSSPWFWLPALVTLAGVTVAVIAWRRGGARWVIALAYHAAMVLPILGLIEIAYFYISPVANHLQYLALLGPAALWGAALSSAGALGRFGVVPRTAAAVALVSLLAFSTGSRVLAFQSDLTLWSSATREQPGALFAAWSLADELGGSGRRAEALEVLARLEGSAPDEATRLRARALLALHERRLEEAAATTAAAWRLRPAYSFQVEVGGLLDRSGRPDLAVSVLRPLVDAAPGYADARLALATALGRTGQAAEAARLLEAGLVADPEERRFRDALEALRPAPR